MTTTTIEGEHTTAEVFLDEADLEDLTKTQIQNMVDHEAFTQPVRVMSDTHPGAGCVIGFTMPLDRENLKVVPNVVGLDVGCGMLAIELSERPDLAYAEIDQRIRDAIPMAWHGHDHQEYHFGKDFPWWDVADNPTQLQKGLGTDFEFSGYDLDYFEALCERAEVDVNKAINQMGTLGGGNHFVEVAWSQRTDNWWVVLHSGSRALGNGVASYWQDRATDLRNQTAAPELTEDDVPDEVREAGGTVEDITGDDHTAIDMDAAATFCRKYFDGEAIEANLNGIRQVQHDREQYQEEYRNTDLDLLEGEAAHGYLVDMAFCQTYAWENRRRMGELIADALEVEIADSIHSPHNLVDFDDLVIRKGATRAHEGERFIVPYNMGAGSVVLSGKGNPEWNRSAPHGAGRNGSRTWAEDTFSMDEFESEMEGVFSTSVTEDTIDEAPMAYKDPEIVEAQIGETGEIIDRLVPVINCKAEW